MFTHDPSDGCWTNWINEAFAEYSSAFAVGQMVSEEQFQKVLDGYRREVRQLPGDAPALAKVPFDGSGFVVRYYKGSLMLDSIRQAMGDAAFGGAVREFFQTYDGKSIGTADFRSFWERKLGDKKELIDVWLDSTGGLPESGNAVAHKLAPHPVPLNNGGTRTGFPRR